MNFLKNNTYIEDYENLYRGIPENQLDDEKTRISSSFLTNHNFEDPTGLSVIRSKNHDVHYCLKQLKRFFCAAEINTGKLRENSELEALHEMSNSNKLHSVIVPKKLINEEERILSKNHIRYLIKHFKIYHHSKP